MTPLRRVRLGTIAATIALSVGGTAHAASDLVEHAHMSDSAFVVCLLVFTLAASLGAAVPPLPARARVGVLRSAGVAANPVVASPEPRVSSAWLQRFRN